MGFPFLKQAGMMECGTTCLAMIFRHYGFYDSRAYLSREAEVTTEGTDLFTLSELAEQFGFETNGYQLPFDQLSAIKLPCIAHFEGNHFVVVYKATADKVWLADPAIGKYTLDKAGFQQKWNGIALELIPQAEVFKTNRTEEAKAFMRQKKGVWQQFYTPALQAVRSLGLVILFSSLLLQLLGLALPLFTQTIIDRVLVSANQKLLYAILLGMLFVFVSQLLLSYSRNRLIAQLKVRFEHQFFSRFFLHFLRLPQAYFDRHKREDFINRFQENLKIRQALNPAVLESLVDIGFMSIYLLMLFLFHKTLALISLLFVAIYIGATLLFSDRLKQLERRLYAENVKTMGSFLDTLLGMQSVRLLGAEKQKYWQWKNQYTHALNRVLDTEKGYITLSTLLKTTLLGGQISVYWLGAFFAFRGELSIGSYIAFITIFVYVANAMGRLSQLWFMLVELSVTFDKLNDVFQEKAVSRDGQPSPALEKPITLSIQQLSFKYQQRAEQHTLQNINLEISPGSFVGILGRNGSGKSTLIKLISGLYEQYEGRILFNGRELRSLNARQLSRKVAVIPQDTYLFNGSIKENIMLGNPAATDAEVIRAARLADLHDFIITQYLGYNQMIGENGINLSGGQRLKLAFARLFVSQSEIIILDEASSALDLETEQRIMENVLTHFRGKTIIAIAHRLQSIRQADCLYVLDRGQLAEEGTHESLSQAGGIYEQFMKSYLAY